MNCRAEETQTLKEMALNQFYWKGGVCWQAAAGRRCRSERYPADGSRASRARPVAAFRTCETGETPALLRFPFDSVQRQWGRNAHAVGSQKKVSWEALQVEPFRSLSGKPPFPWLCLDLGVGGGNLFSASSKEKHEETRNLRSHSETQCMEWLQIQYGLSQARRSLLLRE